MAIGDRSNTRSFGIKLGRSRQPNLLLYLTQRLGDDGQEAGGAVAEDAVDLVREGK